MTGNLFSLDIVITFVFFMIGPFIRFHKKSHLYTVKEIKKFNILNSVIVQIIFIIIISAVNDEPKFNFVPAFLYYFINQGIWTHKIKDDDITTNEEEIENDKETDNKEETSDIMKLLNKK